MSSGWRIATAAPNGTDVTAYLALGTNVGDRESHLAHALRGLAAAGRISGVSSVYETDPVGYEAQGAFLNMVVRLETSLPADALLTRGRTLEEERRRERTFRNAPRTLDIDLLLYGDQSIETEGLTVPHPRMEGRAFVLIPLLELDPDLADPVTGRPFSAMLEASAAGVRRLYPGEKLLEQG